MDADIKAGQIFEDRLGKLWVLAVVNHWVMYSRGEGMKPEVLASHELRQRGLRAFSDQPTRWPT